MTKQKAKDLTIEVWQYLADHPEIACKRDLPWEILEAVIRCVSQCPLCEMFRDEDCVGCPLGNCEDAGSNYWNWYNAETDEDRKKYAQAILCVVKAWKI